jgi:hypothetical protein
MKRSVGPRFERAIEVQNFCGWKGCELEIPPGETRCWKHALRVKNPPRYGATTEPALPMRPQLETICAAVGSVFGDVTAKNIRGKRKHTSISRARMVAMYCARQALKMSLTEIAAEFGGKHHTSVFAATRRAERLIRRGDTQICEAFAVGMKAGRSQKA